MLAGLLSSIFWFGAFLGTQIVAFHLADIQHRSRFIVRLFAIAVAGHAATVALFALTPVPLMAAAAPVNTVLSLTTGLMTMACLFVLYMPFYYSLDTSLSIETIVMLDRSPSRSLPHRDVVHRFTCDEFVHDRLRTMVANRYLVTDGSDHWRLTPRGRRVASIFRSTKLALRLGSGG